ncbi:non-heme iron oxygenase ferredoxin subunit [soil metagenome]
MSDDVRMDAGSVAAANSEQPWHPLGDVQSLFAATDADASASRPGCARTCHSVKVGGVQVALFNVDGTVYAMDDRCTHGNAYLSEGELNGFEVECPMHAGLFDVRTGAVLGAPAVRPARCHQVRVDDGAVFIRITPRA